MGANDCFGINASVIIKAGAALHRGIQHSPDSAIKIKLYVFLSILFHFWKSLGSYKW